MKADIGLIGLAVMGQNLVLNMIDHGYTVAVYNRTVSKVDAFVEEANRNDALIGCHSIEELVEALQKPRKIILMVKAGSPVDDFINQLVPLLEKGDIIIDGGNSHYLDTIRRTKFLEEQGILFVGTGISGGEEGARHGPAIMPGGSKDAWPLIKPIFQDIAAKVDGVPCCEWMGPDGAGHYVKMVHNGIEYADMQLISEAYHLLRYYMKLDVDQISDIFAEWNQGKLKSYLIEITSDILKVKDEDGLPLIDKVLDAAGQKGTGKWTAISSLELGVPTTLITTAVYQRFLSALKDTRVEAASKIKDVDHEEITESSKIDEDFINHLQEALYASKIVAYSQGFQLLSQASKEYNWDLNLGTIALIWRGGCIIRSAFLNKIKEVHDQNPHFEHLILETFFLKKVEMALPSLRKVVMKALSTGIPVPAFAAALTWLDSFRSKYLPANLIQAQRDYFGAHGFERIDYPRGTSFHVNWQEKLKTMKK